MSPRTSGLREALILAGIHEINANGVASFSIRRVADACGVSCAAPYRHFESKRDFIAAIIDYVNDQWAQRQEEILAGAGDSLREQIIAKRIVEEQPAGCSRLRGIQMEGPYFSYAKRGAQNADYLKAPDFEGFKALYEGCNGLVRIVDIAPELPGAEDFVRQASKLCTVSIAHTDCTYDHARAAVDAGVTHLTHLYNAMPGIHHRNPGVIPAAVENPNVRAEIIADGFHIHPASVRLAFTMFKNRMILVSDSGRCAGKDEGYQFDLGGQMAEVRGGVAKLVGTNTIACSGSNMWACLLNTLSWGIPEEEVILAATYNPACALGVQDEVGSIATGKVADFVVCTDNYQNKRVFLAGKEI